MLSTPANTLAASLERKGFHTRYSTFSPSPTCTFIRSIRDQAENHPQLMPTSLNACGTVNRMKEHG